MPIDSPSRQITCTKIAGDTNMYIIQKNTKVFEQKINFIILITRKYADSFFYKTVLHYFRVDDSSFIVKNQTVLCLDWLL